MKVLLCIFSGTGNTFKVANRFAEELNVRGYEADVCRIRSDLPRPDISSYDMLVLGYPVHAFNAPTAVLKFIKNLPLGEGKSACILRTSGEPLKLNDASGILPRRILKKRGYQIKGEFSYVMPYNIIFRHSDGMAARMWQCAESRIARDVALLQRGKNDIKPKINLFKRAVSFTLRIEHAAMPILGRTFRVNKNKCTSCGLCVSLCPMSNITLDGNLPKFSKKCVGCMACAFSCPKDAIKISLLNGWRVNGKYSFDAAPATDDEVCTYCRKAYLRYFHESEICY